MKLAKECYAKLKMTTLQLFTLTISTVLLVSISETNSFIQTGVRLNKADSDSLILEKYKYELEKENLEDIDSVSNEQLDSIFYERRMGFPASGVVYSPDNFFKIFTIELESCGAYCNSEWHSWMHFNLKGKEKIIKVNFAKIDSIYKLPDNKYLIVEKSWGRPASVYSVLCLGAQLISFSADSVIIHTIKYNHHDSFGFCQENGVQSEKEPYINYNSDKKLLTYYYGKNYAYSNEIDTDTIREGQFRYIRGQFVFDKETITVRSPTD